MNLRNLKIKIRLLLLLGIVLIIIGVGSLVGLYSVLWMAGNMDKTSAAYTRTNASIGIGMDVLQIKEIALRDVYPGLKPGAAEKIFAQRNKTERDIEHNAEIAEDVETKGMVAKVKAAYDDFDKVIVSLVNERQAGNEVDLTAYDNQMKSTHEVLISALDNLKQHNIAEVNSAEHSTLVYKTQGMAVIAVMMSLFLIVALYLGLTISNSINKPIATLVEAATKVGEGDLTVKMQASGDDEIGNLENVIGTMAGKLQAMINEEAEARSKMQDQVSELSGLVQQAAKGDLTVSAPDYEGDLGILSTSFNEMTMGLRRLTEKMAEVINHLSSASTEIEVTSQQTASGSNEQAASVSEVTAAVNELATNAKEVARAADSVSEAANEAMAGAASGTEAINEVAIGMEEVKEVTYTNAQKIMALEERSQEIGSILAIINDIAEQTNLLALNAAIEAARAGEAGKGFAVVAQEIRNLAEDVTGATKEIGVKIKEIQSSVNSSVMATEESKKRTEEEVRVIREAGEGLKRIGALTEKTAELAMQISGAVQQQRTASEQVVQTMGEVSEVARQSAIGSHESLRSAKDLADMASELKTMISEFKIN